MAKIGLTNFRYGILTEAEDGTPSYAGAKSLGKQFHAKLIFQIMMQHYMQMMGLQKVIHHSKVEKLQLALIMMIQKLWLKY